MSLSLLAVVVVVVVVGKTWSIKPMPAKVGTSVVVPFRLTATQRAQFDSKIEASGLKLSVFFRQLVLSKPLVFHESTVDLVRLLTIYKVSSDTINSLAFQVNSSFRRGLLSQRRFIHWLNQLASVRELLSAAVQQNNPVARIGSFDVAVVDDSVKSSVVSFRLTAEQVAPLQIIADKAELTVPLVCRELILNQSPLFKRSANHKKRLIFIFNKSSNNISQLAMRSDYLTRKKIVSQQLYVKWLDLLVSIESLFQAGIDNAD
ncbi:hypothetical protein [Pseudomonas kitaguniensis]|uniref:hypothetical protein n=1 Tax=Pseudomonas kitaguniensis TaxID=2607908 RepID=UPI003BA19F4E